MLEDDLDGGPADETLRFGIDGSEYEIDLNDKNAARFHKLLAPFVERARRAGRVPRRAVRRTAASRRRSRDIRMWARRQGIELSERGRIPSSVVERYDANTGAGARQPERTGRGRRRLALREWLLHRGRAAHDRVLERPGLVRRDLAAASANPWGCRGPGFRAGSRSLLPGPPA
jgi:hypothetical protein